MGEEERGFQFANFAESTLAAALPAEATTLRVQAGHGSRFPSLEPSTIDILLPLSSGEGEGTHIGWQQGFSPDATPPEPMVGDARLHIVSQVGGHEDYGEWSYFEILFGAYQDPDPPPPKLTGVRVYSAGDSYTTLYFSDAILDPLNDFGYLLMWESTRVWTVSDDALETRRVSFVMGGTPTASLVLFDPSSGLTEVVYCVGIDGDSLTIERGKEGTTPLPFPAGARVIHTVTAGFFTQLANRQPPLLPLAFAVEVGQYEGYGYIEADHAGGIERGAVNPSSIDGFPLTHMWCIGNRFCFAVEGGDALTLVTSLGYTQVAFEASVSGTGEMLPPIPLSEFDEHPGMPGMARSPSLGSNFNSWRSTDLGLTKRVVFS